MAQIDRRLNVEAPVEHRNQGLRDIADDAAAAGRADDQLEIAVPVEHHGRRHRAARALARLNPVGDRPAAARRQKGEVG